MKNILLIDGFGFVKASLKSLINVNDELRLASEANASVSVIDHIKKFDIDVVVLDVSSPQRNGLEVLADIKCSYPEVPILIINGREQVDFAANFLLQGCNGYISTQCKYEHIIEGIKEVSQGREYIRPKHLYDKAKVCLYKTGGHYGLSQRELQIFFKLVIGKSNSEIANELNVSSSTVSIFKSKIYRKMHFKNNADLIIYALNNYCSSQIYLMQQTVAKEAYSLSWS